MILGKDKQLIIDLKNSLSEKENENLELKREIQNFKMNTDCGLQKYSDIDFAKILASSSTISVFPNVRLEEGENEKTLVFEVCIKNEEFLERFPLFKEVVELLNIYSNTKRVAMYKLLKNTCEFAKDMFEIYKKMYFSNCNILIEDVGINEDLNMYFQV